MLLKVTALLLFFLEAALCWPAQVETRPAFCKDHACPTYTLLSKTDDYEVREYPPSTWLKTDAQPFTSKQQMLEKLIMYIKATGIAMTVPVLKEHIFTSPGIRSLAVYLPQDIREYPPPHKSDIYLEVSQPLTVYVRPFTNDNWHNEALALKAVAPSDAITAYYYRVPYDPPWSTDRHNEIWMVKKE